LLARTFGSPTNKSSTNKKKPAVTMTAGFTRVGRLADD
jgi:hypothetical protein